MTWHGMAMESCGMRYDMTVKKKFVADALQGSGGAHSRLAGEWRQESDRTRGKRQVKSSMTSRQLGPCQIMYGMAWHGTAWHDMK